MLYGDYDTHRQSSYCFYKINPSSGNLKWINNGYKPNSQGYGSPRQPLGFSRSLTNLTFIWHDKAFPGCWVNISQWKNWLKYILCNLQQLGHPLCWTGRRDIDKKLHKLLGDYRLYWHSLSSGKGHETKGLVTWDWTDC